MTAIFVLADAGLSDAGEVEKHLSSVAGKRYAIEVVSTLDALQNRLEDVRQAVVFFSASIEKTAPLIQQCRSLLPGTAFVSIIDEAVASKPPVLETDCHFVRRPLDPFILLTQLSGAVRQAELLAAIADTAQLDESTSLYNRRHFIQRLGEEISLSKRHLSPLCCVTLGVNFYQMYLDSYGYDFINELLRYLADKIGSVVRHEDIVARISDDEIAILLPRSTEKGAKVFTNRLILDLNASVFKYGGYEEEISICAGLAGYPFADNSKADADTVIRYARHALHQARCSSAEHVKVQLFSEIKPAL